MDQDETCRAGRPRPRPHYVKWGSSSPFTKEHSPQFSADVHCGQTAGCTKMPPRAEVGLVPGDIVLGGDPAPPKGHSNPHIRPMFIVAKRSPISATAELFLYLNTAKSLCINCM